MVNNDYNSSINHYDSRITNQILNKINIIKNGGENFYEIHMEDDLWRQQSSTENCTTGTDNGRKSQKSKVMNSDALNMRTSERTPSKMSMKSTRIEEINKQCQ